MIISYLSSPFSFMSFHSISFVHVAHSFMLLILSCIHWFLRSFTHSFTHHPTHSSLIHSLIFWFVHSYFLPFIHSFTHSLFRFIHLLTIFSFTHSFISFCFMFISFHFVFISASFPFSFISCNTMQFPFNFVSFHFASCLSFHVSSCFRSNSFHCVSFQASLFHFISFHCCELVWFYFASFCFIHSLIHPFVHWFVHFIGFICGHSIGISKGVCVIVGAPRPPQSFIASDFRKHSSRPANFYSRLSFSKLIKKSVWNFGAALCHLNAWTTNRFSMIFQVW